jgi:hypothetical protein
VSLGHRPKVPDYPADQALKVRFNPVPRGEVNRAFSAGVLERWESWGGAPRLEVNTSPLALRFLIKIVAFDVENAIPTGAIIFERDLPAQLH